MNERENDADDKTEEASEERRRQYREEGKVANPREIVHSLALLVLALAFSSLGGRLGEALLTLFRRSWHDLRPAQVTTDGFGRILYLTVEPLLPLLAGIGLLLVLVPVVMGLLLTRFNWTWKKLTFDLNNINPVSGIGRVFSLKAIPELIKSVGKVTVFGTISYFIIKDSLWDAPRNHSVDVRDMSSSLGAVILKLMFATAAGGMVVGAADWAWSWWQLERQMRMTKQEVKDEYKQQEGDPHVRSQRRRMARDMILHRSMQNVPKASFIVTNPEHFAVAIRYVKGMAAPIVVAKGMDFLALRIREVAKKNDIIIVENKALARTLYKTVKIGQEVPQSLYSSIIEVMKYIRAARGADYFERVTQVGDKV